MARQAARHSVVVTHRCRCVAPLGAPSQRRYGAGPRFLTRRFALPPALRRRSLSGDRAFRASGKPCGPPSASSSQGVIVPPGGAPAPPGSGRSVRLPPAGAASDPTCMTPHESALGGPNACIINPPRRARISLLSIFFAVWRWRHSESLPRGPQNKNPAGVPAGLLRDLPMTAIRSPS